MSEHDAVVRAAVLLAAALAHPSLDDVAALIAGEPIAASDFTADPPEGWRDAHTLLLEHRPRGLRTSEIAEQARRTVEQHPGLTVDDDELHYRAIPGVDLAALVREARTPLIPAPTRKGAPSTRPPKHLTAQGVSYTVEDAPTPEPVEISPRAARPVRMDRDAILAIASRLDDLDPGKPRHAILRALFEHLSPAEEAVPNGMRQLVTPTGRGKSLLTHLWTLALVAEGHKVSLVLPRGKDVANAARALELDAAKLGLQLTTAMLDGAGGSQRRLASAFNAEETEATLWHLERLGYTCRLEAGAEPERDPPYKPGHEPCRKVYDTHHKRRVCPFLTTCDRYREWRKAPTADVLIANHHALATGRYPLPVRLGPDAPERSVSTAEVLFRLSDLVLIDEIDALQVVVAGAESSGLPLTWRRGQHRSVALLTAIERLANRPGSRDPSRFRQDLNLLLWLGPSLDSMFRRQQITWPRRARFLVPHVLARRVEASLKDRGLRIQVTREDTTPDDHPVQRFVDHLWTMPTDHEDALLERVQHLQGLLTEVFRDDQVRLVRTRDDLVLAVLLGRMEAALLRVQRRLPELADEEIHEASAWDAALGLQIDWAPMMHGALGRSLFAFHGPSPHRGGDKPLSVCRLDGFPHLTISELGDTAARLLCGEGRPVVGLSATSVFPASPAYDVRAPLGWGEHDTDVGVYMQRLTQLGDDGKPIAVSGRSDRASSIKVLADRLAPSITRILDQLVSEDGFASRDRAIIATLSYADAHAAALALQHRLPPGTVATLVADSGTPPQGVPSDALLRASEVERFAEGTARLLVAPLGVVARGHNIVDEHGRSVVGAVFLLVRPVPPADDVTRLLQHVSYAAMLAREQTTANGPGARLLAARGAANAALHELASADGGLSSQPKHLRDPVIADVFADVVQLAGRARRPGPALIAGHRAAPVRLFLVDGAFDAPTLNWTDELKRIVSSWAGDPRQPLTLHHAWVHALGLPTESPRSST